MDTPTTLKEEVLSEVQEAIKHILSKLRTVDGDYYRKVFEDVEAFLSDRKL